MNDQMEQMVTTTLGDVPSSDLHWTNAEEDRGDVVVVTREWIYQGSDPEKAEHVGKMVRRDVWATFKTGLATQVAGDL
jgi:hypothetical protein